MLVLTRKVGQSIEIGEDVKVFVQYLGKGRVSIGIEAPREVPITRDGVKRREAPDDDERLSA